MQIIQMFSRFLLSCAAAVVLSLPVYAENWPTTEFVFKNIDQTKVKKYKLGGFNINIDTNNPFDDFNDQQKPVVAEYEKYLSEVAVYYQDMGFKAPPLPMTEGHNGGKAYLVYMYDFPATEPSTALAGYFAGGTIDLSLDLARAIVQGQHVERAFEDLAHELFHNVQRAYQLSDNLDHGTWIMEGQAQALGMEAAKLLRGIDVNKDVLEKQGYWLGGRAYYRPLTTEIKDQNYRTASFWRYIGEHVAASKANGRAGVVRTAPDYKYLAKIYNNHPFKGPVSAAGDLKWLDDSLEKEVGLGLDRLYPNFISTFAAYAPARFNEALFSSSNQKHIDDWLDYVYGLCPTVSLSTSTSSGSVKAALRKNASRCFKANVSGAGKFDVSIQAHADTAQMLEALHIGVSDGTKVSMATVIPSPTGGGYIGHWRFRIPAGVTQVFIISNMAIEPAKTLNQDVVLDLTASHFDSSMTKATPEAQPQQIKGVKKTSANLSTDATREAAQKDIAAGLVSLSSQTAMGSRAFFKRDRDPCKQPFAILGCGPTTTIQLSLTPGVLGDFSLTMGTGGMVGQFLSHLTGIADNGIANTNEALLAAQQKVIETEGSEVNIVIPVIEYGFTGAFDNAHIAVSGANDAGPFQAMDSQSQHNGHVTIEEFTPFVLRGKFSAALTRTSAADYTQVSHRNISGNFVVAAPWEGDRDIKINRSSSSDAAIQDLAEVIPILGTLDLTAPIKSGASGTDASQSTTSISKAGAFPSCNCTCQPIESYDAVCRPICEVKVQQCASQVTQQAALTESQNKQAELDKLANDVDRMRADFKAFMRDNNMAHMQDTMLASFDQQPTPEAKRFLLFTYGMPVDGYGKNK